jgi:hypothetical protein
MVLRALCIGVVDSAYGNGLFDPLPGAHSDAVAVAVYLGRCGFRNKEIVVPTGEGLVAEAVQANLFSLVDATDAEDLAVFYFSGHGYRYRDCSRDEKDDTWDESLVCADRPVGDDWFGHTLWPLAKPRARFVVVVDACHSATAASAFERPDPTPRLDRDLEGREYWRVTLAACRDEEDAGDGSSGGFVTAAMLKFLQGETRPNHLELWSQVGGLIDGTYGNQGIGSPRIASAGPDDSLLFAPAFAPR